MVAPYRKKIMLEILNIKGKSNSLFIDFLSEANSSATRGAGVTDSVGASSEKAYAFNGTSAAYFEFPSNKVALFGFINKPFELEIVLWLNSTATMQFLGNLVNGSGSSDYAFSANKIGRAHV